MSNREMHRELTEMHIMALYDFMEPFDYANIDEITLDFMMKRQELGKQRYMNDPIFNRRVQVMVSQTMSIIDRHRPRT